VKTATLPPLRVEPELRRQVEALLAPGETLSTFVEQAVRANVERRAADQAFAARALASREASRASGSYHPAAEVIRQLAFRNTAARARRGKRR